MDTSNEPVNITVENNATLVVAPDRLTNYAPPVAGDPDGWALGLPGAVTTDVVYYTGP
jgi:hypothetical protein